MLKEILFSVCCIGFLLKGCECYSFAIKSLLEDGESIPKSEWTTIYVEDISPNQSKGLVSVSVNVPDSALQQNSSVSIFFANESRQILRIKFEKKVKIIFYDTPYKVNQVVQESEFTPCADQKFQLCCQFTKAWLPKNCAKINAAVVFPNGTIYNNYGIKNYKISIPDLMVVEEYKKRNCV